MFSAMPAMYLLPLQSNENSSLKLIAWLIKLNTVLKHSIILAAHDYLEFTQTQEQEMWEGPQASVSRGENTHICRYFVTIQEICICDKSGGDTTWDMVTQPCPGFPQSRGKEGNVLNASLLIKWTQKYLSTEISMQFILCLRYEAASCSFRLTGETWQGCGC